MRQPFLKVKIKALAAEARIIREAEQRIRREMHNCRHWFDSGENTHSGHLNRRQGEIKEGFEEHWRQHHADLMALKAHRKGENGRSGLRYEARHSFLAYAFLRDKPYHRIEEKVHEGNEPNAGKIHKMVERFGGKRNAGEVEAWLKAA